MNATQAAQKRKLHTGKYSAGCRTKRTVQQASTQSKWTHRKTRSRSGHLPPLTTLSRKLGGRWRRCRHAWNVVTASAAITMKIHPIGPSLSTRNILCQRQYHSSDCSIRGLKLNSCISINENWFQAIIPPKKHYALTCLEHKTWSDILNV